MLNRYASVTSYYTANYNIIHKLFGSVETDYMATDSSPDCYLCNELIACYDKDDNGVFYLKLED